MSFVKIIYDKTFYDYDKADTVAMAILGLFLTSDVGCCSASIFKEWACNDNWGDACSGNITALEKEDNYILLSDLYSDEAVPTELKMTRYQFVKLLDDWEEKVCRDKLKEVIIKYENDEFTIETKN